MDTLFSLLLGPSIMVILAFVGYYIFLEYKHSQTTYFASTKKRLIYLWSHLGEYGEYLIYKQLSYREANGTKFLFNCYIPKKDGETTEIDVIMINKSGIFVFESKNYSGWIFGDERGQYWTQTLPTGRTAMKNRFFNPILQNHLHISSLKEFLAEELPIYSVIVFSNRCIFKNLKITNKNDLVIHREEVDRALNWLENNETTKATIDVEKIYQQIFKTSQVSDAIKQQHVLNIEKKHRPPVTNQQSSPAHEQTLTHVQKNENSSSQTNKEIPQPLCPKCGSLLVLRKAKSGSNAGTQFWGCSSFPKCRFTEPFKGLPIQETNEIKTKE